MFRLTMVFLALLAAFSFQGSRGLYETTEGRYAECSREMLESDNYLEPTLNYRPHFTKPPLTYWAIAGGMRLLGPNEWGVRLYNAIAFFLTVLAIAWIGATLWGKPTGIMAGLIYASSPFPVFGAYAVSTDTLLTLWGISAVLCYLKASHGRSSLERKTWLVAMWVFFGLGFLTKGPPALILFLPILVWHIYHKEQRNFKLANPLGIFLFILIGFSWYLIVCYRNPGLLSYFLGHEVVGRIASNSAHNHQWYKPFTIYLPVLTLGAGPWLYFGLKIIRKKRLFNPVIFRSYLRRDSYGFFLLLWLLLPLIIFFLVKSRLELYVLPLYAPIALATARGICRNSGGTYILRRVTTVAVLTVFALVGLKGAMSFLPNKNNMKPLYDTCQRISGGNVEEVIAFNKSKLYGLQFYMDGRLQRVSPDGKESWADGSIDGTIRKMKSSASLPSYVLVSDREQAPVLCNVLRKSGLQFLRSNNEYWGAYLIVPAHPSVSTTASGVTTSPTNGSSLAPETSGT